MAHSLEDKIFACHGDGARQTNRFTYFHIFRKFPPSCLVSYFNFNFQSEQPQWNGSGYYGYQQGYDAYGGYAAQPPQDPNMYYGGYPGYANYQQPQQVR